MGLSVTLAVRNEAKMLPQTLPSIYALDPDEVIFGLDRCTDDTERIVKAEAKRHPETHTRVINYGESDGRGWNFRRAYLRWSLGEASSNEVVISTAGDIFLDPKLRKVLRLIPDRYRILSLGYLDRPWTPQTFLRFLAAESRIFYGFSGVLAYSRSAWLETEDLDDLKRIYIGEDTHLHRAIKSKYPARFVNTNTFHLRPNEDPSHHYRRGVAQWESLHKGYLGSFIHSLLLIRPMVFTGYRHARMGEVSGAQIAYRRDLFGRGSS